MARQRDRDVERFARLDRRAVGDGCDAFSTSCRVVSMARIRPAAVRAASRMASADCSAAAATSDALPSIPRAANGSGAGLTAELCADGGGTEHVMRDRRFELARQFDAFAAGDDRHRDFCLIGLCRISASSERHVRQRVQDFAKFADCRRHDASSGKNGLDCQPHCMKPERCPKIVPSGMSGAHCARQAYLQATCCSPLPAHAEYVERSMALGYSRRGIVFFQRFGKRSRPRPAWPDRHWLF